MRSDRSRRRPGLPAATVLAGAVAPAALAGP